MVCLNKFMDGFSDGITSYILNDSPEDMCDAVVIFKECTYKVANLPAKTLVSGMVSIANQFYDKLSCIDFEEGIITNSQYTLLHYNLFRTRFIIRWFWI